MLFRLDSSSTDNLRFLDFESPAAIAVASFFTGTTTLQASDSASDSGVMAIALSFSEAVEDFGDDGAEEGGVPWSAAEDAVSLSVAFAAVGGENKRNHAELSKILRLDCQLSANLTQLVRLS